MLLLYVMAFFGVLIPVIHLSSHKSAHEVFTVFQNLGGWSSQTLSFFVGFVSVSTSFLGTLSLELECPRLSDQVLYLGVDGCDHIAEEMQNAQKMIPVSMLSAVALNGSLGFAMLLALLFSMGDIVEQTSSDTGYPFIDIYTYAVGSVQGGTTLVRTNHP